jgi:hypothetical protein
VLSLVWLLLYGCLAETNRTPFDFAEGESEFVSGFNVEYGGGGFALIFLAEYASILGRACSNINTKHNKYNRHATTNQIILSLVTEVKEKISP